MPDTAPAPKLRAVAGADQVARLAAHDCAARRAARSRTTSSETSRDAIDLRRAQPVPARASCARMSTLNGSQPTATARQSQAHADATSMRCARPWRRRWSAIRRVFVFGLDVDDHKAHPGIDPRPAGAFGPERVFNTPLSEDAMTGVAIGAAMAGMRPIHVHIRMDFLMLCMNQLVNMAAKSRYMYGGQRQACRWSCAA